MLRSSNRRVQQVLSQRRFSDAKPTPEKSAPKLVTADKLNKSNNGGSSSLLMPVGIAVVAGLSVAGYMNYFTEPAKAPKVTIPIPPVQTKPKIESRPLVEQKGETKPVEEQNNDVKEVDTTTSNKSDENKSIDSEDPVLGNFTDNTSTSNQEEENNDSIEINTENAYKQSNVASPKQNHEEKIIHNEKKEE
eukprot:CAMPEP_0114331756 /NCGR_PEP_ID=MMETSP0101-20121206/2630_1 /TAXON_ID=38822 ORGANISM="Pteridomonas danica, Strain PT" /NCGR_SAMPLE_ID=MMETSP0101 /ASSEMBLY_ACC=CAM_ASM_000211 /LENGTH=190 /DNA_ID=CAMNT_0001462207 /DNA_START=15 /DNA_END=584 /DNA_ORIENTATION=-